MNTYQVQKLINTGIDKLTGFDIDAALRRSLVFDFYSRQQIEDYQTQHLQKLLKIASCSDYYKPFAGKNLGNFPHMSREEYSKHYEQLITNYNTVYYLRRSSGSTGSPVRHQVTREMLLAKRVSHLKMLHWYGLSRESTECKIGGMPADLKTRLYYRLKNKLYFNSHIINDIHFPELVRRYNTFNPMVLYGYPSMLQRFVIMAHKAGVELRSPEIVVTHAENLYAEYLETFHDFFPEAKIVNQYWATEGNIAETCPKGNLHIAEDTVICEVLNKGNDGTGDLYLTNLFSYRVPIIRYKTGDRIKLSSKPCSCGRNTRIIEKIEGREIEYLELPDGRRHPVTAIYLTSYTRNILTYQLVHYRKEKKVVLNYIPVRENESIERDHIYRHMKEKFGLHTEFSATGELHRTTGGKVKRLIVAD